MKTKFLFLIMIVVSSLSFGQKDNRVKVGYSWLSSAFFENEEESWGLHSYGFTVNSLELSYNRKLYKWFRAETGISYVFSNYTAEIQGTPGFIKRDDKLSMISFPLVLSTEFFKYFYLKGGITIDFQTNEPEESDKQSGVGSLFGLGGKYDYQDYTFSLGIQYQNRRVLKSFTKVDSFSNYLHQIGFNFSISYNF